MLNETLSAGSVADALVARRFMILCGVLLAASFYYMLRSLVLAVRSGYRRLSRQPGWAVERFGAHLAMSATWAFVIAIAGTLLAFAVNLGSSYQPIQGARAAGVVVCTNGSVTFSPGPGYPGRPAKVALTRRQYALEGHLLLFHRILQIAGLPSSHRIVSIVGRDAPAIPDRSSRQGAVGNPDPFFGAIQKIDPYLPFIQARVVRSPFMNRSHAKLTLYAFEGGYSFLSPGNPEDL